ncbi:MAG: sulfite oxidase, partial [Acidobacteriota bacterium]|nr:sulfite oxidase [Acidobacteriota bacterium]
TPNELFFVRNNGGSLGIRETDWRLVVEGDAVEKGIRISYEGIRSLPAHTLTAYLECAGNHRAMFDRVQGRAAEGTQWGTGGIGNGIWRGARLADVLELAGITGTAASVLLIGLDSEAPEEGFRRALPANKALADVLLAYELNGEPLPQDHGFPVRALVPGWVGSSSIKWLGRIEVSSEPHWTRNNTGSYVLIGDSYPPEGRAMGQIATTQTIKSALALPWPAELVPGSHTLHGFAQSPDGRIDRVEWSDDGGATWNDARLTGVQTELSWRRFEFDWEPAPGVYTVMTRATDHTGATQPDSVPWNRKGYLFNQPLPHPIQVG